MQIKISKSGFLKELNFIQGVVEKKNTIPILSSLLLEASGGNLNIKGTDLDVSISTNCDAEVIAEGSVCLQAKKLFEIVKALPEAEIEIKVGVGAGPHRARVLLINTINNRSSSAIKITSRYSDILLYYTPTWQKISQSKNCCHNRYDKCRIIYHCSPLITEANSELHREQQDGRWRGNTALYAYNTK